MYKVNTIGRFVVYDDVEQNSTYIFDPLSLNILSLDNSSESYPIIRLCIEQRDSSSSVEISKQLEAYFIRLPNLFRINYDKLPKHFQIILPISSKCNLKCPYCFARTNGKFQFEDFSFENIKSIIDYFHGEKDLLSVNYAFFGGEPCLRFDLIQEAVNYAKFHYVKDKISFSITSNGTILPDEYLDFIKENKISLLVSLDGPEGTNNHRNYVDGRSSVGTVVENIERCKAKGIHIALRATITKDCPDFVALYDYFEKTGIPFDIELAYKSGNVEDTIAQYSEKDISHLENQFRKVSSYYFGRISNGLPIFNSSLIKSLTQLKYRSSRSRHCAGGINIFSITNSGYVYACEHLIHDKNFAVGKLLENDIESIKFCLSAKDVSELFDCQNCELLNLCLGGCFSQKLLSGHKQDGTLADDDCAIQKIKWGSIIVLYSRLCRHCKQFINQLSEEEL